MRNLKENRYLTTLKIAKRARQILEGARPLVETKHRNPIKIAQLEIALGKLDPESIKINPLEDFSFYK